MFLVCIITHAYHEVCGFSRDKRIPGTLGFSYEHKKAAAIFETQFGITV